MRGNVSVTRMETGEEMEEGGDMQNGVEEEQRRWWEKITLGEGHPTLLSSVRVANLVSYRVEGREYICDDIVIIWTVAR